MDLRWPFVLLLAVGAAGAAAWLATRRRDYGWQGQLPYLARSFRITELPEYQRALRAHQRLLVAALAVVLIAVTALVVAAARPARTYHPSPPGSDTPYVDIMVCFGPLFVVQFANKNGLVPLLSALRTHVEGFGNQRIGMTSQYYRTIPVTADREWVTDRLDRIIDTVSAANEARAAGDLSAAFGSQEDGLFERRTGPLANPRDTLAMCAMGLPAVGAENGRSRMIVYVGDINGGMVDPSAQPLYSEEYLKKTITNAGIQVNAIAPDLATGPMGFTEKLVRDSGGKVVAYTEVDSLFGEPPQRMQDNLSDELDTAVDTVLADPPPSALDVAREHARAPFQWDVPNLLLQLALIAAVALAALRWGLRL
ncbi:hypothetical protein CRI77_02770 [Mycolicibacterium duvalii]|uniref:Uncharacterized protein n=1 Tax=Mycolicibacterium duvalii TaxID=39688 RepID=A0A7I7K089_9MYCO|nr:hypothetical protein [Mycolicibacterium duvalii]MCV7366776.1 hypothetical protein [Mycolicibacterium duvalii]PEG43908.1 hypothetical protein CRI77_02770 [Mycolicibacterium duvalii]BBX16762.1 hypothetical protein MDUV_16220 [Mycolicibacterium duvalii]